MFFTFDPPTTTLFRTPLIEDERLAAIAVFADTIRPADRLHTSATLARLKLVSSVTQVRTGDVVFFTAADHRCSVASDLLCDLVIV